MPLPREGIRAGAGDKGDWQQKKTTCFFSSQILRMFFEGSIIWQSELFAGMNNNLGILGYCYYNEIVYCKDKFYFG